MSSLIALLHRPLYKPHATQNFPIRSDEGLTVETLAFKLCTMTNLHFQLS